MEGMQGKKWSNFDASSFASTYSQNVQSSGIKSYNNLSSGASFTKPVTGDYGVPSNVNLTTSYSVVGINVGKIGNVQTAIKSYVTTIQGIIDELQVAANKAQAFKSNNGVVENSINTFLTNVQTDCRNLVSQLLAFYDKLTDVTRAYESAMGALADNINTTNSGMSAGTEYTEGQI